MDLRYPIGKFQRPEQVTADERDRLLGEIEAAPAALRSAVAGLTDSQLDTPYRPGGWTVRQVVHHVPESHMNSYIRFKLALTEHEPVIKPYEEQLWAELPDSGLPIEVSLTYWTRYTNVGCTCCVRWRRAISRGHSCIRQSERCVSIRTWLCMPGMAGIIRRISRRCASGWSGGRLHRAYDSRAALRIAIVPRPATNRLRPARSLRRQTKHPATAILPLARTCWRSNETARDALPALCPACRATLRRCA